MSIPELMRILLVVAGCERDELTKDSKHVRVFLFGRRDPFARLELNLKSGYSVLGDEE